MELAQILNAGGLAGLAVGVTNGLLAWSLARMFAVSAEDLRPTTSQGYALRVLLHLIAGIGLALLYWLSWGLAALVNVTWWQRGLAFAAITWGVTCLPFAFAVLATQRWRWRAAALALTQWLYSFVLIGLACAWSWVKGP